MYAERWSVAYVCSEWMLISLEYSDSELNNETLAKLFYIFCLEFIWT